jgi:hypothetical protein
MSATETPSDMILVAKGELPCETCGKPHNAYRPRDEQKMWGSWASLDDGHVYKTPSWETMYRREVARHALAATGGTEAS